MPTEYKRIREIAGPLLLVEGVKKAAYNEMGEILLPSGEKRLCRVLEAAEGYALVQLFESAAGLSAETCRVRFAGRGMALPVSPGLLGRVFDGLGRPIDGGTRRNSSRPAFPPSTG